MTGPGRDGGRFGGGGFEGGTSRIVPARVYGGFGRAGIPAAPPRSAPIGEGMRMRAPVGARLGTPMRAPAAGAPAGGGMRIGVPAGGAPVGGGMRTSAPMGGGMHVGAPMGGAPMRMPAAPMAASAPAMHMPAPAPAAAPAMHAPAAPPLAPPPPAAHH